MNFDFNWRPNDYFNDLTLDQKLGSSIKGELRREIVRDAIENDDVPSSMMSSSLEPDVRKLVGRMHPTMMGGEYLPDLAENEVEICRIVLKSTTMDVTSLRARFVEGRLEFSAVDEYGDNEYVLQYTNAELPLSLGEMIENIETCRVIDRDSGEENSDYGQGLVLPHLRIQAENEEHRDEAIEFVTVHSVYYPQIEDFYEEHKQKVADDIFKPMSEQKGVETLADPKMKKLFEWAETLVGSENIDLIMNHPEKQKIFFAGIRMSVDAAGGDPDRVEEHQIIMACKAALGSDYGNPRSTIEVLKELEKTTDVLLDALHNKDTDKATEAITIMLHQGMDGFGKVSPTMNNLFPVWDAIYTHIQNENIERAMSQTNTWKTQLKELMGLVSSNQDGRSN